VRKDAALTMTVVRPALCSEVLSFTLSYTLDFRRIRPADVRLLQEVRQQNVVEYQEIRHKRTGAVKRRVPFVVGSRKIFHARVVGYQDSFTAVVYEGSHADRVGSPLPDIACLNLCLRL
jgi:hypothetical protein